MQKATDEMYNFSNPKRVGPGAWMMFMVMSANSDDTQLARLWVCKQIRLFVDYFGCGDCTPHARKKVRECPPEDYIQSNRTLFRWVVTFMNEVNTRLGKGVYDEETLWKRFSEKDFVVCTSGCGGSTGPSTTAPSPRNAGTPQPSASQASALQSSASQASARGSALSANTRRRSLKLVSYGM